MPYESKICDFGWKAKDFKLLSTDNNYYTLSELKGEKGTLIIFICNHCPYVKAIADRLSIEVSALKDLEVNTIAIMSNDVNSYPEDSFENMKKFKEHYHFDFHYLYDKDQKIAKEYNAICTPDFFGFNNKLELQYRGRLDDGTNKKNNNLKRELYFAMKNISISGNGPKIQLPSIGCSIKWKNNE